MNTVLRFLLLALSALFLAQGCDSSSPSKDDLLDDSSQDLIADQALEDAEDASDIHDRDADATDLADAADQVDATDAFDVNDTEDGDMLCIPANCSDDDFCGQLDDGCGGTLECGGCTAPETCGGGGIDNQCGCTPTSCNAEGAQCGEITDGCGNTLQCGTCDEGDICGGNGVANQCGSEPCTPETCQSLGVECGDISDGCESTLNCGGCTTPESCGGDGTPNVCGCSPTNCAAEGAECGELSDGCEGILSCGGCTLPETCGGDGTANQCGCAPTTCMAEGAECGDISDGCGALLGCGGCGSNESCSSNACVCDAGYHDCSGTCVSDNDVNSCGSSCSPCLADPNGTSGCDGVSCTLVCDLLFHRTASGCSAWSSELPPFMGSEGLDNAIGVNSAGLPVIAFSDLKTGGNDSVLTELDNMGSWTFTDIDVSGARTGDAIELAMGGDTPHVVYHYSTNNRRRVVYATQDNMGTWQFTNLEDWNGFGTSKTNVGATDIALKGNGYPVVLHATSDFVTVTGGGMDFRVSIKIKEFNGSSWSNTVVDDTLRTSSKSLAMALDQNDEPHILYYAWSRDELIYAWRSGGTWNSEVVVKPGHSSGGGSITLTSAGTPHVSWVDDTDQLHHLVRAAPATWQDTVVAQDAGGTDRHRIALDSAESPVIAFQQTKSSYEILSFARLEADVWVIEEADNSFDAVVGELDLHMDGDTPHISYHNRNNDLKYATVP